MTPTESLHTHTTLSDGKMTHRELFDLAESLGVSVLAFTDHDAVPSPEIMRELEGLRGRDTKWVIGTEITCNLPRELASNSASIHLIGLFIDPTNAALVEHSRRAQASRVRRMKQIVVGLQSLGFTITEEDCLEASGGESVGRPHIVEALKKHRGNNPVIEKLRLEMKAAAVHDIKIQEQYNYMIEKGEHQYPYMLFLSPDAFRSVYVEHDYMPNLDEAVALIRDAGGITILAHYYTVRNKLPIDILEKLLAEKRLDGVEVVYGIREYGTDNETVIEKERAVLREMSERHGTIMAGGSDAHTKEDLAFYVDNDWFSGETAGFTANILATGKVSKQFSSLE
ncbi:MAG: PHP domain-containing protein [Minisyncoccota bacterium]